MDIRALLIAWASTLEGESAMSYERYTPSTPGKHRIHPAVPWVLFFVALAILVVGTVLDNPVWMLSAPVALGGALSLIHISEPTRLYPKSRMPSSA